MKTRVSMIAGNDKCGLNTANNLCIYDNVAVSNRFVDESRHLIVCEFCDKIGPVPIIQEPVCSISDDLALRLLSVALPEDSIILSCESTRGEFTISVYGTLTDPSARGFVRSFCVVLLDNRLLHRNHYSSIQRAISLVQMKKNILKDRNKKYFKAQQLLDSADVKLKRRRTCSVDSICNYTNYRNPHEIVRMRINRSWSFIGGRHAWTFSELTGTNENSNIHRTDKITLSKGLAKMCNQYPQFVVRLLFACLRGLAVIVIGVYPDSQIFKVIEHLVGQRAVEIKSSTLTLSHISTNKLIYIRNAHIRIDRMVWPYCSVYDVFSGMLLGPDYKGRLIQTLNISSRLPDEACESYILANITDLLQWACIFKKNKQTKLPVSFDRNDIEILQYYNKLNKNYLRSYTTSISKVLAPVIR
ncbi:hypothetical protein GJ496_004496 [Pomphorhynchus laevis]|nr:hypothetical protein GJ496_004496 [Pomphorhynchus laevis]